jgi:hypothetical protein
VLRLLRPAEAAARRLIIVAARGMVVAVLPVRPPSHTATIVPPPPRLRSGLGEPPVSPVLRTPPASRVVEGHQASPPHLSSPLSGGEVPGASEAEREALKAIARYPRSGKRTSAPRLSFPLFDPLRRFRRRRPARNGVPRISFPGFSDPFPIPLPPSADDPVDARCLALRLAAIARVLDDLPREARRFARWRARREAGLVRRTWPLRPGRPPGRRPAHGGRPWHAVDDILETVHGLAFWALEDTS